jgi:hypothetical protein
MAYAAGDSAAEPTARVGRVQLALSSATLMRALRFILVIAFSLVSSPGCGLWKPVMTPASTEIAVIELETSRLPATSRIVVKGDGTAELWSSNKLVARQQVEVKEVNELLARMLDLKFFELSDVMDRGMTPHQESYQLTLRYSGREHSVGFDDNRFASDLQDLAAKVRAIAHRDFWQPKQTAETRAD